MTLRPLLAALTLAVPGLAQGAAASPGDPGAAARPKAKVAALGFQALGAATPEDQARAALLGEVAVTELASFGTFQVIGRSDITNLLALERQRQLLGCSDDTCMAEIGGALGVQYLLTGSVGVLEGTIRVDVRLLDVKKARPEGHAGESVAGHGAQLTHAVRRLVREACKPLLPKDLALAPLPPAGVSASVGGMSGTRAAGLAIGVVGLAALVGGGVSGGLAYASYKDVEAASKGGDVPRYDGARSDFSARALSADVLLGIGAAALVTGVVLFVVGGEGAPAQVAVLPTPSGATVAVAGEF